MDRCGNSDSNTNGYGRTIVMWELVVLYGVTKSGIGGNITYDISSYNQCKQVLETTMMSERIINSVSNDGVVLMFCMPKKK